ncbi:MAG: DUF6596 domain-containing protein [Pseudomonadota bacterium]
MTDTAALQASLVAARPRVIAALAAHLRDLDAAEEAFAEACAALVGVEHEPQNLAAWLLTVAKRKAIDAIRRRQTEASAAEAAAMVSEMVEIIKLPEPIPDERLRLIFICCHPALALEARAALALRIICGLPVDAIARIFVTSEATMFQRITRAKTKIRQAGVSFELPARKAWPERLEAVLLTLELAYTAAYQDAGGERDSELASEVERLAMLVAELFSEEPEALGLAALVILARSREGARLGLDGAMVPLSQQDTSRWDLERIEQARKLLDEAAHLAQTGPYQVMAAIQLTHARRAFDGAVDWPAILALYDALMVLRPGPLVALNRALAVGEAEGAARGLAEWDELPAEPLLDARPYHVAHAQLLSANGDHKGALGALERALALAPAPAERQFMEARCKTLRDLIDAGDVSAKVLPNRRAEGDRPA